jgi:hypothetical protein
MLFDVFDYDIWATLGAKFVLGFEHIFCMKAHP